MTTAFSLLTKLGGLLQDSVDVSPPWLSVPQASLHFKPHAALLHLIQCLPSDPLRFIIQSVVDIISAQCCTTLNVPEGKVKVLASSLACHSTGSACSTCQSGALLLAACYERLGE